MDFPDSLQSMHSGSEKVDSTRNEMNRKSDEPRSNFEEVAGDIPAPEPSGTESSKPCSKLAPKIPEQKTPGRPPKHPNHAEKHGAENTEIGAENILPLSGKPRSFPGKKSSPCGEALDLFAGAGRRCHEVRRHLLQGAKHQGHEAPGLSPAKLADRLWS